jgi:hypothetical protein
MNEDGHSCALDGERQSGEDGGRKSLAEKFHRSWQLVPCTTRFFPLRQPAKLISIRRPRRLRGVKCDQWQSAGVEASTGLLSASTADGHHALVHQPFTTLDRNFEKRAEPVSCATNGVKCHVSCDMAVMELRGHVRLSKNTSIWPRCHAQGCDLLPLALVVVSGTAVAPTESLRTLVVRDLCMLKEQL